MSSTKKGFRPMNDQKRREKARCLLDITSAYASRDSAFSKSSNSRNIYTNVYFSKKQERSTRAIASHVSTPDNKVKIVSDAKFESSSSSSKSESWSSSGEEVCFPGHGKCHK